MQKPHCMAWLSWKACCIGVSSPPAEARSSTVLTVLPSAWTARVEQERTASPSTITVQAPQ